MVNLDQYPPLKNLMTLLGRDDAAMPDASLEPIDTERGEKPIGTLTAGEAHLFRYMREKRGAARRIKEVMEESQEMFEHGLKELDKVAEEAEFANTMFWMLLRTRLGDAPDKIGIRADFQIVQIPYDCGCDKGLQCGVVLMGFLDPYTGEQNIDAVPENPEDLPEGVGIEVEIAVVPGTFRGIIET